MTQDKVTVTQGDIYCANKCFDFTDEAEQAHAVNRAVPIIARYRTAAEADARKREAVLVEALGLAEDALRNHACCGLDAPCLRSIEQCRTDCGKLAGQALDAVVAALANLRERREFGIPTWERITKEFGGD